MRPETLKELQIALNQSDGVVKESSLVIMSIDVYREIMGVATEAEFSASVEALRRSFNEAQQGMTRPLSESLDDLGQKYEVPS